MKLYKEWLEKAFYKDGKSNETVWSAYMAAEQKVYERIIGEKREHISGTVAELSKEFNMPAEEVAAFIDGINEALPEAYDLKELEEDTPVTLDIDFQKLYKKMVEYKAEHLYTLPEWNEIFDEEKQKALYTEQKKSRTVVKGEKIGRNDPCPCGSGKKYKKCCGANQ